MSSFSEKTGDHLFGIASCASSFCWLIVKHPYSRLLFTCGLIRVNPRFITCHDVIDVFRSTAIVHKPFVERLTNCVGSKANKFFWQSNIDRSHDDLAISVVAQHQWFPEQWLILDDLHEIRLEVNYDFGWIQTTIDKQWSLMEFHRQKLN